MEKMIVQYDKKNIFIVVLVAILVVLFVIIVNLIYSLSIVQNLLMCWIITTVYSLFAFFIIDNKVIRPESEKIIERPVEVIREIMVPFENKVTEIIEKPVIKEVPVYIREPRIEEKLNIPKYNYIASSETKKYHKRNCRYGKLIKEKYKISNNEAAFFEKMNFKACKICINH